MTNIKLLFQMCNFVYYKSSPLHNVLQKNSPFIILVRLFKLILNQNMHSITCTIRLALIIIIISPEKNGHSYIYGT